MVTQKAISARIKYETMWKLDQEVMLGYYSRNAILNEGAKMYLDLIDRRRRFRTITDRKIKKDMLRGFLKLYFPEAEEEGFF